jgi:hypothetical protein
MVKNTRRKGLAENQQKGAFGMMVAIRFWLFKRISAVGWWVCPEPHKSNLLRRMSFDAVHGERAIKSTAPVRSAP